jgi:ParB family chromosome partitioning protein
MTHTYGSPAPFFRSPEGDGSGPDQKSAPKKSAPVSRLGRGLGALIPAATPRTPGSTASPKSAGADSVMAEPKLPATPIANPDSIPQTPASIRPGAPVGSASAAMSETRSHAAPTSATPGRTGATIPVPPPPEPVQVHPTGMMTSVQDATSTDPRSTWNTGSDQTVVNIPIARIQRNPRQPRERFDDAALRALADSIRQDGLLQPIVVRASRTITEPGGIQLYELIAGERRLRAFTLLGRSTIPALVQRVDDRTSAVLALIENVQREDLNPMERAHGLQRLMHEFTLSQQDLATRVGLDRSTVANLLRLNDLDPHTAGALREGAISTGHAKALLGLSDVSVRKGLVARIVNDGMSVRELEIVVRQTSSRAPGSVTAGRLPATGRVISAQVADLERRIGAHLGTDVQLKTGRKPGSGAITIKFASHSQFEGLMERIGFDLEASERPRGR